MTKYSLLLIGFLFATFAYAAVDSRCPICNMKFSETAKTSFESTREGKPVKFCSFSCARKFHLKFPDEPLFAKDYETGSKLDAKEAYFLIKSSNVLKELDFDMPPSVVAFSKEALAKKTKERLKDGEVVKGIKAVEKAYE